MKNRYKKNVVKTLVTEFVPSLIDGTSYRFPVRTALCVRKDDRGDLSLFDNCNIAFFYEKTMGLGNQIIHTNIKWEDDQKKELRMFIRELLLIIKSDIFQKNGMLSATKLKWFRPLSFKGDIKEKFNEIWKEEAAYILNISEDQIECITESEAPYYYFSKKNSFNSVDAVSVVDIGGGSSDFVYFVDGKPQIASSVHFGCDVLWGNGFNSLENARDNGIFEKFKELIHLGEADDSLEELNSKMVRDGRLSTKDIINFWISNDKKSGISKELKKSYKPLFLYHFASIVYFMAKMYKEKGLDSPRSVLFCGNGSKYIDGLLSSDKSTIKDIVTKIFKNVYGEIKDIQIILPESRKECTCYGGLFRDPNAETPSEFNFQGVSDKEYKNVREIIEDFPTIRKSLLKTYEDFTRLYEELLNILVEKEELEIKVEEHKELIDKISSGVMDSLDKNFKTQVVKLYENEVYHDSIFFLPVIDNILLLTQNPTK